MKMINPLNSWLLEGVLESIKEIPIKNWEEEQGLPEHFKTSRDGVEIMLRPRRRGTSLICKGKGRYMFESDARDYEGGRIADIYNKIQTLKKRFGGNGSGIIGMSDWQYQNYFIGTRAYPAGSGAEVRIGFNHYFYAEGQFIGSWSERLDREYEYRYVSVSEVAIKLNPKNKMSDKLARKAIKYLETTGQLWEFMKMAMQGADMGGPGQ